MSDPVQKRGYVNLFNGDPNNSEQVQVNFTLITTGNETQNQIEATMKQKAKQVLQAAIALL